MRYVLQHPNETRPSLLVEVVDTVNGDVLRNMRKTMLKAGCANALVIDPQRVRVLRDTFRDLSESSIEEEVALDTVLLLGERGELRMRVQRWLDAMAQNWSEVLPKEQWAAPLMYDIVPAVSGSIVRRAEPDAA